MLKQINKRGGAVLKTVGLIVLYFVIDGLKVGVGDWTGKDVTPSVAHFLAEQPGVLVVALVGVAIVAHAIGKTSVDPDEAVRKAETDAAAAHLRAEDAERRLEAVAADLTDVRDHATRLVGYISVICHLLQAFRETDHGRLDQAAIDDHINRDVLAPAMTAARSVNSPITAIGVFERPVWDRRPTDSNDWTHMKVRWLAPPGGRLEGIHRAEKQITICDGRQAVLVAFAAEPLSSPDESFINAVAELAAAFSTAHYGATRRPATTKRGGKRGARTGQRRRGGR